MPPLISCLMVTQPGRATLIQKAVACFHRQTYEQRELVIVHDSHSNADAFGQFLQTEIESARIVSAEPGRTLGELRNVAIEQAKGELVCQWDDDDQYHPDRLKRQSDAMRESQADACFLASQLHYFAESRDLYARDMGRRGIEGTVMHRRRLPARYPAMGKEEDTVFMRNLASHSSTTVLHGAPWLYLRVFHGNNTWDEKHHRGMMRSAWDVTLLRQWQDDIVTHIESYDIDHPVTVRGRNGRAFSISTPTISKGVLPPTDSLIAGPTARACAGS